MRPPNQQDALVVLCLLRLLKIALYTLLFPLACLYRVRTVHVVKLRHVLLVASRLAAVFCAFACIGIVSRVSVYYRRLGNSQQSAQHSQPSSQTKQQHRTAKLSYSVSPERLLFLVIATRLPGSQASAILLLGCLLHGRRSLLVAHLYTASVCCSINRRDQNILVVEGGNTGPEGERHIDLEVAHIDPGLEEDHNNCNAVSGCAISSDVLMRDLRLLGLLGVVVGHFVCGLRRSECSR